MLKHFISRKTVVLRRYKGSREIISLAGGSGDRVPRRKEVMSMAHKVTLIPGDGSGPEVVAAAKRVVEATGVDIQWDEMEAGAAMIEKYGTPL
ncbi:MAG: isocitrate/isopropylmalate family dehydrogenase, partial [Anaerotignum sp.]